MDRIFMDCRGPRVLVDVVLGVFTKRSTQKVKNGVEAPQPEISLEWVVPANVPGADVKGHIVGVALFRLFDQPGSFLC